MKIEHLTIDQKAQMPNYVAKWTDIGRSCEPLNYDAAVVAVNAAYRVAGLQPPKRFVICDSPLSGAITAAVLAGDSVGASVRASVWNSVRASVQDSVQASVWNSVGASVRASVWNSVQDSVWNSVQASVWNSVQASVWNSVRNSVGASVWNSVGASVRASVWNSVQDSVQDSVWNSVQDSVQDSVWNSVQDSVFGAHDACWLAFYDYFRTAVGLRSQTEMLAPLIELAHHCGWWLPYKHVCILQHRHSELHFDAQDRLHNANGMAIRYRDGWGVYAWHGTRLPLEKGWIIEAPNSIDINAIDAERNAEIRRVMLELFGHDRYVLESGLGPVQSDEYGELFRKPLDNDEDIVMVRVQNSTPDPAGEFRRYLLRVPPSIQTAREAVAWTFSIDSAQYQPMKES